MRILQIAPPWFPAAPTSYRGIDWIVSSLADGLTALGHDVVRAGNGDSATGTAFVRAVDVSIPHERDDTWIDAAHAVTAYLHAEEFDLIHDHTGIIGPSIAAVAGLQVPVINTLHGPWTPENAVLYRTISRRIALTAISHDQAGRAPDGVRVAAVVHNGIELDAYPVGHDRDEFLLFDGHACAQDGPLIALEVARRLGRRLVMVLQATTPEEQRYLEQVLRPAMAEVDGDLRTTVTPGQRVALMGRTRALLVPAGWDEPFSLEMAEAAACGAPVIAFRHGSASELVLDGITGRLVAPGDIDAMAAAVDEVATFDPLDCRAWAEGRFSARRMVRRYLRIYEELASHAGTNGSYRRSSRTADEAAAWASARAMHPSNGGPTLRLVPSRMPHDPRPSHTADLA
jgi:glycosyltransferase involved in cell wall biosynthesis